MLKELRVRSMAKTGVTLEVMNMLKSETILVRAGDEDIGGGLSAGGGTRAGDRWQVGGCCSLVRTEILKTMKNAFIVKSFLLFVNLHLALDYILTISHT